MFCSNCENQATNKKIVVKDGFETTVHFCDACYEQENEQSFNKSVNIGEFFENFSENNKDSEELLCGFCNTSSIFFRNRLCWV